MFKSEVDDSPDVLRWLDCMLVRMCQSSRTTEGGPDELLSDGRFSIYPQSMFYLRRCQVFNHSADANIFYRYVSELLPFTRHSSPC